MAMIRNSMGMLVDMTVPTHPGPFTIFQTPQPGPDAMLTVDGPVPYPARPDSSGGQPGGQGPLTKTNAGTDTIDQMRKAAMSSYHRNAQLADGFYYNPFTTLTPYSYYAGALSQMDTLRRANTYRPRWYCIPDDFNQPLQAYETLEYQIAVTGGSYLWGMRFIQYSPTWDQQAPANVVIQISESCTGIELFREFMSPAGIAFYTAGSFGRGFHLPHILTQPRLFLEPGNVDIEMCNLSGDTQNCQLTLYFAEPADIVEQAKLSGRI